MSGDVNGNVKRSQAINVRKFSPPNCSEITKEFWLRYKVTLAVVWSVAKTLLISLCMIQLRPDEMTLVQHFINTYECIRKKISFFTHICGVTFKKWIKIDFHISFPRQSLIARISDTNKSGIPVQTSSLSTLLLYFICLPMYFCIFYLFSFMSVFLK